MGRRGCFPVSPGLEEYLESLRRDTLQAVEREEAQQKANDRRDTSTAYAKVLFKIMFEMIFIWGVLYSKLFNSEFTIIYYTFTISHCLISILTASQAQKALSEKNKGGDERLTTKNKCIEELEAAEKIKRLELKKGLMMRFRINVSKM